MITATDNWLAANAKLAKKPVRLIEIEGYGKAFSSPSDLDTSSGLPLQGVIQYASRIVDVGGLSLFPSSVTPAQAVTAGNIIFVFIYNASSETTASLAIDDTGSNTWIPIYSDSSIRGWYAIANSTGSITISVSGSSHGAIGGGNFEIYAMEVSAKFAGFAATGATGTSNPAIITAGSTTIVFPCATSPAWHLILVELASASGPALPITLLFARVNLAGVGPIPGASLISGGAASTVYAIVGDATVLPWILNVDPLSETVSDLDGGSDLSDLVFTVQDRRQLITADMAGFIFEGKKVVFKEGFVGLAYEDYLPRFTGKIESVDSGNANLEYTFTCPDIRKDLSQIIFATGDDGFATSSDHPKTLNDHPLNILIDLLENEIGWDASIIDIAKIQLWRGTIYSGVQFLFRKITSAPVAKDFIENEIMKPLGAYHRTNNLGVFTVNFFYPINPAPVATLDHGTLTDVPNAQQAALVNQSVFRFDYSDDDKPQAEKVASYKPSLDKYALAGENIIESRGLRSAFGGYAIAAIVSRLIFLRYANKQLQFESLPNIWSQSLLEPGDIVSVTSAIVPDRELGVLGITAKSFEILDRAWDPMQGIASFKLLAVDLAKFKPSLIPPNAEADFLSASPSDEDTYLFLSGDDGKYSNGTPANTLC
jgi:hypothetical protein